MNDLKNTRIHGDLIVDSDINVVDGTIKINNTEIVRKVAGKSGDVTLTPDDVGAVPTSRKINNKELTSDITLTPTDIGKKVVNFTQASWSGGKFTIPASTHGQSTSKLIVQVYGTNDEEQICGITRNASGDIIISSDSTFAGYAVMI